LVLETGSMKFRHVDGKCTGSSMKLLARDPWVCAWNDIW